MGTRGVQLMSGSSSAARRSGGASHVRRAYLPRPSHALLAYCLLVCDTLPLPHLCRRVWRRARRGARLQGRRPALGGDWRRELRRGLLPRARRAGAAPPGRPCRWAAGVGGQRDGPRCCCSTMVGCNQAPWSTPRLACRSTSPACPPEAHWRHPSLPSTPPAHPLARWPCRDPLPRPPQWSSSPLPASTRPT